MPRPANSLVEPVADRGELRGAADDVVDRHLADERAVDLDRERHRRPGAGQPRSRRTSARKDAGRPSRRAGRWRPRAPARRRCATPGLAPAPSRRTAVQRAARVDARRRLQRDRPLPRVSGRSRRPAPTACTSSGSSTARPSFTPPREPGRLTTRQVPTTPASPRESAAVGTPFADAVRPDRLGDAGHLAVEQRAGHLGGPVGRGQAGAAGGEHDAGAAVDGRGDRRADRVAVGYDDRCADVEAPAPAGRRRSAGRSSSS